MFYSAFSTDRQELIRLLSLNYARWSKSDQGRVLGGQGSNDVRVRPRLST
jgi:hypothetical protein